MSDASANSTQGVSLKKGVRERSAAPANHRTHQRPPKRPAHPSNPLVAQLNNNWRVVDDRLQWILQRKKGKPRDKTSGWRGRAFCRTQEALLRCIREYCGEVRVEALAKLKSLPDWHPDWNRTNLDVRGTDMSKPSSDQNR